MLLSILKQWKGFKNLLRFEKGVNKGYEYAAKFLPVIWQIWGQNKRIEDPWAIKQSISIFVRDGLKNIIGWVKNIWLVMEIIFIEQNIIVSENWQGRKFKSI